jgi:uncharacterized membrane protein YeaQ/YmgE (transglycosylase-associated protein family)
MDPTLEALLVVGGIGGIGGLVGGLLGSADNLFMTILMGIIGGIALSALFRFGEWPGIYTYGPQEFSLVWSAVGGLILGFFVARAN